MENSYISQNHAMQIEIYQWSRTTTPNKLRWMLHVTPFAHLVACCCVLLGVVAKSLKPVKRLATATPNFLERAMLGVVVSVCSLLFMVAVLELKRLRFNGVSNIKRT